MECFCGSNHSFSSCCEIVHLNIKNAVQAEQLMRARYAAFVVQNIDFLYNSVHPTTRRFHNKKDILEWAKANKWMQLQIIQATTNTVEFQAHYLDANLELHIHHEKSTFKIFQDVWYYVDGIML